MSPCQRDEECLGLDESDTTRRLSCMLPMIAGYVMGTRASARASGMSVVANAMTPGPTADFGVLDDRIDRTLVVIEALWTMLKQHGHSDEELASIIAQLDSADGLADGKRSKAPTTCSSCGSKVAAGLKNCQICGHSTGYIPGPLDQI